MRFTCTSTVSAIALMMPAMAYAQMTPSEYLAEMQSIYEMQGFDFAYETQRESGDGIILEGLTFGAEILDAKLDMALASMSIRPTATPGYDLAVEVAPNTSGSFIALDPLGETIELEFSLTSSGMYWVGGPAGKRKIELAYPSVDLTYGITDGIEDLSMGKITLSFADMSGTMEYDLGQKEQSFQIFAPSVSGSVVFEDESDASVEVSLEYEGLAFAGQGPIVDIKDPAAAYGSDLLTEFDTKVASSVVGFSFKDSGSETNLAVRAGPSVLDFAGGRGQVDYAVSAQDVKLDVRGDNMPLPPISVEMDLYKAGVAMPIVPYPDDGTVAVRIDLAGVIVSDSLWGMIDAGSTIPRDPANIRLDLESSAKALVSLMDQDALLQFGGVPWEFKDLTLREFFVQAGGAEVRGSGAATIDNTGPFPFPVGAMDLRLEGVNGLMGKLAEIGLLSPEQTMPAQMMLGMFAVATDEPDTFESRIESGADGSITANGIPLQ